MTLSVEKLEIKGLTGIIYVTIENPNYSINFYLVTILNLEALESVNDVIKILFLSSLLFKRIFMTSHMELSSAS